MKQWLNTLRSDTKTQKTYMVLAAICAAYTALVLGNITRWSIWFDEAYTAYLLRFNLADITHFTALDVHPPLYYWLLKGWTGMFGDGELALRSMSLLFGIVAIIGMYVLVQRVFQSPRWALWASAAVALSPIVIRFGHEARMYTLVLAIVIWATYVLVRASATRSGMNRWWVGYAVLIMLGMLTHYYAALAWLAHWVWRLFERRAGRIKQFWSAGWIWSHVLAVGMFAWWLPTAVRQFMTLQNGFWIPPISAYTPIDYLTNMLMYLQYGAATGWWALVFVLTVIAAIVVVRLGYVYVVKRSPSGVNLLLTLAVVPPLILTVLSMPPLTPTFMDRYIVFSQVALLALVVIMAVALYERSKKNRSYVRAFAAALAVSLAIGVGFVYYYGNYNKNSSTSIRSREVVQKIEATGSENTQPIIAATPWLFYESVPYASDQHPVYFTDQSADGYPYGSLAMLEQHDEHKILDIHEFARKHRYVWYLNTTTEGDVEPPVESWRQITSVEVYDSINDNTNYRASLFDTQPRSRD